MLKTANKLSNSALNFDERILGLRLIAADEDFFLGTSYTIEWKKIKSTKLGAERLIYSNDCNFFLQD